MTDEELITCVNHFRQYGEIEFRPASLPNASFTLVAKKDLPEGAMIWDTSEYVYRVPVEEETVRGHLVWDRQKQDFKFVTSSTGDYVRWEDYERDCR